MTSSPAYILLTYKIYVSGRTIAHLQDLLKNSKIRDKEISLNLEFKHYI